ASVQSEPGSNSPVDKLGESDHLNLTRIKRAVICDLFCSTRYLIVKDRCVSLSKRPPSGRKWNLVNLFRLVNNFFT
ncbi:MAG TPA: hypothetical protein DEB70_09000, partial [Planctomycetaceae bacterium]|nr:hypothetical protein [Planctomycetaceae bacterium]